MIIMINEIFFVGSATHFSNVKLLFYQSFLPGSHGMVRYLLVSFFFFLFSCFFFLFLFSFFFFEILANQFGDVNTRFHFTTSFVLCAHMCTPSIPCGISLLMQILVSLESKTFSLCNFQWISNAISFQILCKFTFAFPNFATSQL